MSIRKITKADVDSAYKIAAEAARNAKFSTQRARQLKTGADKIKADYKRAQKSKGFKK